MKKDKTLKPRREHVKSKLLLRWFLNLITAVVGGSAAALIIYYLLTK